MSSVRVAGGGTGGSYRSMPHMQSSRGIVPWKAKSSTLGLGAACCF